MDIQARMVDGRGLDAAGRIRLADGKIVEAKKGGKAGDTLVVPGVFDLSMNFGALGAIADEMRAAAASGTTRVCCMPDENFPLDSPRAVNIFHGCMPAGGGRILPVGAATMGLRGERMSEMAALKEAGCVAFGNAMQPYANAQILLQILTYAAFLDMPVFIRPQDDSLASHGCAHDGPVATRLGLPAIPAVAETVMLAQCLALAEAAGARVHFCRLSCARSVEFIAEAKARGLPVTADVAVHQLFFTEDDLRTFDTNFHVSPPYRGATDRDALRDGVRDGVIDIVCSDHRPHAPDAKQAPFPDSRLGVATAQLLLPLLWKLVDDGALSLTRAVDAVSVAPARLLGLEASLDKGADADLCVVKRQAWRPCETEWHSRGANHPFGETQFNWRVAQTIAGDTMYKAKQ